MQKMLVENTYDLLVDACYFGDETLQIIFTSSCSEIDMLKSSSGCLVFSSMFTSCACLHKWSCV